MSPPRHPPVHDRRSVTLFGLPLLRNHSGGNGWGKMESKFSGLALKVANGSFFEELFVGFVAGFDVGLAISPPGSSSRGPKGIELSRPCWIGSRRRHKRNNKREITSDDVMRVPARPLKEQFSRGSEAWKEQSDPIFRFWTEGDWWGFPFFSLNASRYFARKKRYVSIGRSEPCSSRVQRCWISTAVFAPTGRRVSRRMGKTSRTSS